MKRFCLLLLILLVGCNETQKYSISIIRPDGGVQEVYEIERTDYPTVTYRYYYGRVEGTSIEAPQGWFIRVEEIKPQVDKEI